MECNTVGHINDQELSLKIAQHLEPNPVAYKWNKELTHIVSELGMWVFVTAEYKKCKDFVNDPAMTVMLLGTKAQTHLVVLQYNYISGEYMCEFAAGASSHNGIVRSRIIGRAVAEAYAKAEGLI